MKKLILFFITLFLVVGLYAQNSAYSENILKDYGTFKLETDEGNIISVGAFTTVELVNPTHHDGNDELNVTLKLKKGAGNSKQQELLVPEYHIDIYLVSKSVFEGEGTSTWLDGVRIFIDSVDIRKDQFPDGFLVSVKTVPTLIHSFHTNNKSVDIEITWETALYEPRIRK